MLRKVAPVLLIVFMLIAGNPGSGGALEGISRRDNALWLSLAPAAGKTPICELHGNADNASVGEKKSVRVGLRNGAVNQQVKGRKPQRPKLDFESEHRPIPVRTYFLQGGELSTAARAYLLHPDGSQGKLELVRDSPAKVFFKMPMNDGYCHGPNNVYVVDRQVKNGELIVRTAKWITVHHSCRWGHDYRNDNIRLGARSLAEIPLDIVIDGLWDGNFHVRTSSGDQLRIRALVFGKPVKDAGVTLITEKNWSHTETTDQDGIARIQLIRDYYPGSWSSFNQSQPGHLNFKVQYQLEQGGVYLDQSYSRIRYITTLPWKYTPASADYASYAYGLGLGFAGLLISGFGIFIYYERRRKPYRVIKFDE